jgi:hypothetical protein
VSVMGDPESQCGNVAYAYVWFKKAPLRQVSSATNSCKPSA